MAPVLSLAHSLTHALATLPLFSSSLVAHYFTNSLLHCTAQHYTMLSDDEKAFLLVSPQEMDPVKSFFLNAIQAKSSVRRND